MKNKIIFLIICLIIILSITACDETNRGDTPMMASWIMLTHISHLNYNEFTDAHVRGEESWISEETFHEVKRIRTDNVDHATYELLKFDNGEMILVEFATKPEEGVYKVQGIKIVPDEMKDFFK